MPRFVFGRISIQPASAKRARCPVTEEASANPRLCASSVRLGGTPWRRMCVLILSRTSCCRFVSSRMVWISSASFSALRFPIPPSFKHIRFCALHVLTVHKAKKGWTNANI